MKGKITIWGRKALPAWLLVVILVVSGAGAAAGTVLAGKVVGEVPVAVSQALLVEQPTDACNLATLEDKTGDATAEWSTTRAHTGTYSAKLNAGYTGSDWAEVVLTPPAGITLADMATITTGWSWWYYIETLGQRGTSLELHFQSATDPDGYAEMTVMNLAYGAPAWGGPPPVGAWTEQTIVSTATTGLIFGTTEAGVAFPDFPVGNEGTIAALVAHVISLDANAGAWVLEEVRPALGWIGASVTTAYIDDVTINGVFYPLDICDLGGIATVPQGTQKHFASPNRYIGAVADDNTGFQFASEIAVGDLYLIALPLKNASENELVALMTLNVPDCLEVEVVSADQIHSLGNVTEAIRIGLNTWKVTLLADAEYNPMTDNLYIAIQADDVCPPGYYTISGTIKQIPY